MFSVYNSSVDVMANVMFGNLSLERFLHATVETMAISLSGVIWKYIVLALNELKPLFIEKLLMIIAK